MSANVCVAAPSGLVPASGEPPPVPPRPAVPVVPPRPAVPVVPPRPAVPIAPANPVVPAPPVVPACPETLLPPEPPVPAFPVVPASPVVPACPDVVIDDWAPPRPVVPAVAIEPAVPVVPALALAPAPVVPAMPGPPAPASPETLVPLAPAGVPRFFARSSMSIGSLAAQPRQNPSVATARNLRRAGLCRGMTSGGPGELRLLMASGRVISRSRGKKTSSNRAFFAAKNASPRVRFLH